MRSLANDFRPFSVPLVVYRELSIDFSEDLFTFFDKTESGEIIDTFIYDNIRYGYDIHTPIIQGGRLVFHKSSHNHEIDVLFQRNALQNGVICNGRFWEPVDEKGIPLFDPETAFNNIPPITTRLLSIW